jgi:hypothetical protein
LVAAKCEENHIFTGVFLRICPEHRGAAEAPANQGMPVMKTRFTGSWVLAGRANLALALGLVLALLGAGSALADLATPEQRRACTPDVYRLCAGEIPNVRAITACLRRQKASLSDACRAVFEQ